jgi:hypothetical protein
LDNLNILQDGIGKKGKKRLTPEEQIKLARDVANYLLGDPQNHIEPLTITHITTLKNFKTRQSVYNYIKLAVKLNYIQLDDQGKAILPKITPQGKFSKFTKTNKLSNNKIISDWYKGKLDAGITLANPMLNLIELLLNNIGITPEEFIFEGKRDKKQIEKWRSELVDLYMARNCVTNRKLKYGGRDSFKLRINYAIASLCADHGITWARSKNSPMSRKIVNHAQFSDIRFTNEEFVKADLWLKENYGLDSDLFRWFWVGVQSCARQGALFSCPLDFFYESDDLIVLKMYESKTKHLNKGIWKKYIKRKDTIESLRLLKKRNPKTHRIYENKEGLTNDELKKYFITHLRKLYGYLGKSEDSYFYSKPNHTLRHLGGHFLLALGSYTNHSIVKKLGGWHTTDEMEKSYGELPEDHINQELNKYNFEGLD